jgi:hypothetical protein
MSIPAAGKNTTEYWAKIRAEVVALSLILTGIVIAFYELSLEKTLEALVGVSLCAVGAYVLASTTGSYAQSRGTVKGLSGQPPVQVKSRNL